MNTTPETKTFRGRSLEEVLPQVRDELGPDAIVLRRREGLAGGVAGFFQRSYVEVEARGAIEAEGAPIETRNDRATAEGLATQGIQTLVEQASPFADALKTADRAHEVLAELAAEQVDLAIAAGGRPVLLCSARVRRHLRMLCEQRLPQMAVCSYNEIAPGIGVETTGVISAAQAVAA